MLNALNEGGGGLRSVQMIDSTISRVRHQAAGAIRGTQSQGFGRSNGGFTAKVHLRAKGERLAVATEITGGEVSDDNGYDLVMDAEGPEPKVLVADKGYEADRIRDDMEECGGVAVIPMRSGISYFVNRT